VLDSNLFAERGRTHGQRLAIVRNRPKNRHCEICAHLSGLLWVAAYRTNCRSGQGGARARAEWRRTPARAPASFGAWCVHQTGFRRHRPRTGIRAESCRPCLRAAEMEVRSLARSPTWNTLLPQPDRMGGTEQRSAANRRGGPRHCFPRLFAAFRTCYGFSGASVSPCSSWLSLSAWSVRTILPLRASTLTSAPLLNSTL
jgi:hypothetical protein